MSTQPTPEQVAAVVKVLGAKLSDTLSPDCLAAQSDIRIVLQALAQAQADLASLQRRFDLLNQTPGPGFANNWGYRGGANDR